MQGTLAGTDNWFHDPAAQVSAHFGVGRDGTVYQWVDTTDTAWAEMAYNDVGISIEHEGVTGERLTAKQLHATTLLMEWIHDEYPGIPLTRTMDPAGTGIIGHGELGVSGGDHPDCPGSPILSQLDATFRIRSAPATKEAPVNIKVPSSQQLSSLVRQAAAIFGLITVSENTWHLPTSVRAVVAAVSGSLLIVEHYLSDPSTGTPAPKA
jgi:hypothetical protein